MNELKFQFSSKNVLPREVESAFGIKFSYSRCIGDKTISGMVVKENFGTYDFFKMKKADDLIIKMNSFIDIIEGKNLNNCDFSFYFVLSRNSGIIFDRNILKRITKNDIELEIEVRR